MKTCRHCGTPDQTASKRPGSYTVLCAECHLDMVRTSAPANPVGPQVRVWTPRPTGVLAYNPFRLANGQSS